MSRQNQNAGSDYPFGSKLSNKDFFWYSTDYFALAAAGGAATENINIEADSDFYWTATTYQADVAGAALTVATNVVALVDFNLVDTGSGMYLFNVPAPLDSIAGDGKNPYRLPRPRIFAAQSTLQLKFTNFSAATAYNLKVTLHGFKLKRNPKGI